MEGMSTAAETIERLAREAERLKIIQLAEDCKDLKELLESSKQRTIKRDSGPPDK